jgi:Xaa-Pro aminopeptidase
MLIAPFALVVPSEDGHASEYIARCDARREYISGFSGSAGCAVITLDKAALATDGRYFNQASKQLDENWTLLKQGLQDVPTWQEWSSEQASGGKLVGVDPTLISGSTAKKLAEKIKRAGGQELVAIDDNLIDSVWGENRPLRPCEPVVVLPDRLAGKDVQTKLAELRQEISKKDSPGFVISILDEVAWLFNLRGRDIPYNPVFFSYAIVTADTATLYIDSSRLHPEAKLHLKNNDILVKPYEKIIDDAKALRETARSLADQRGRGRFLLSNRASWALKRALGDDEMVDEIRSPIGDAKAVKNTLEMAGMRACHTRDGAALIEFFAWLEHELVTKKSIITEADAADKLEFLRSRKQDYVGLSFDTISSTGAKYVTWHLHTLQPML